MVILREHRLQCRQFSRHFEIKGSWQATYCWVRPLLVRHAPNVEAVTVSQRENSELLYLNGSGPIGYPFARIQLVDALFRHVAEQIVKERSGEQLLVEEVTEWTWQMLELGHIRLIIGTGDQPSLGYEHCSEEEVQRDAANQNRKLVRERRRIQRRQPGQTPYQRLLRRARAS
jgi:hypothetical protein